MLRRTLIVLGCASLLAPAAGALADDTPQEAKPPCCRKPKAVNTTEAAPTKMKCSLTGKVVDKCCCVERDGKKHCTLADKTVETCCCKPVEGEDKAGAATR